ncbi:MAG: serine/threonine protein kinase [Comamonadaceae bacterium]|nr:MAG: serine/threonine protein kinase [Comamonadaceae bacterium]
MDHPKRLGKYDIVQVLGEGAMGVVYKGHDPGIDRPVAIKTIRKALMDADTGADMAARFRNEAKAVGRLLHPGIVAIYEYGEDDSTAFIAMEYVQGRDLSQILGATPRLPEGTVIRFMQQLLDALTCAHRAGVWHRDIKPANLIVTTDGLLKVTDFGIARIESAALTQMAATIGTPGYMAPEQYMGEAIDHRIDIFAAGVLLYRMLTGRSPFAGESAEAVMYKVLNKDPEPPSQLPGLDAPRSFDAVVARALAKSPQARFASAQEFRDALAERSALHAGSAADDATVVASLLLPVRRPDGLPPSSAASRVGSAAPSRWDAASLAPMEAALTRFMGPMARLLVREAARTATDLSALQDALCQHLPDAADRARFITLLSGAAGTAVRRSTASGLGSAAGTAGSSGGSSGGVAVAPAGVQAPIAPELVEHARLTLSRELGPIAKVVLKKALAQARSPQHLHELLAQQIDDPAQRARLLDALRARRG